MPTCWYHGRRAAIHCAGPLSGGLPERTISLGPAADDRANNDRRPFPATDRSPRLLDGGRRDNELSRPSVSGPPSLPRKNPPPTAEPSRPQGVCCLLRLPCRVVISAAGQGSRGSSFLRLWRRGRFGQTLLKCRARRGGRPLLAGVVPSR